MNTRICLPCLVLLMPPVVSRAQTVEDWLVDPAPFRASVTASPAGNDLVITNGLVRRTLRLTPNAATVDYTNRLTREQLIRAAGPEARVTLDGRTYEIGGLHGQPVGNYLKQEWIDGLRANPAAYRFVDWKEGPLEARFAWKKRPEWLAKDLPWPAPGRQVTLRFAPPAVSSITPGMPIFEEDFTGGMDNGWKTRVSPKHPRSSFANEGKHGEIMALPDTSVYAERPWPEQAASVEAVVDAGDDTLSNAWGPGIALMTPKGGVCFVIRPNQQCYDLNGNPQPLKFDRAKPCKLRVTLDGLSATCEAAQEDAAYQHVGVLALPAPPTALRVGKVGQAARGDDYPDARGEGPSAATSPA